MEVKGKLGISGRIARAFLQSKLTPLIVLASLLLGAFAVIATPREEEPQITVPMIDVMASYPGASAAEVEERVTRPMEKFLWEIPGVEYVYSISNTGQSLVIVRFYVNEDVERSIVKVYNKLMSNYDKIPPGVSQPLVRPKAIDDVPVLAFTLWSDRYAGYELRRIAVELANEIKKDKDVSEVNIIGGQKRRVRVELLPANLNAYNLPLIAVADALKKSNILLPSGEFPRDNESFSVEAGGFLEKASDVGDVVVGVYQGKPVYLKNVANIKDGPDEPGDYVFMGLGPQFSKRAPNFKGSALGIRDAVTISVAKKKGTNAALLSKRLEKKIEELKGKLIPTAVNVTNTRNYGETAKEKSDELLEHMFIATVSVIILIGLALGGRESIVVAVAVPVTLALTLLTNYLYGYTLNRVTLFALIFSIGILVDDAIVVVENIHRHFKIYGASARHVAGAVDEVGNPTILATFTVIAALLPMAFVRGLMGPYMRPIPVGASAAMIFSLIIAFVVSPWMSWKVLKNVRPEGEEKESKVLHRVYKKLLGPLLEERKKRLIALMSVAGLLGLVLLMFPLKLVTVKMLPFDNKSEFQVIIDMPEGATLEDTGRAAYAMGQYLRTVPEVTDFQIYAGTSAPFNFNGLVRHYYLRSGPNVADIQVNFVNKGLRKAQSHDIAKRIRASLARIAGSYNGRVKVAEIPPGPPVLSTLVTEVYGPDLKGQLAIAKDIMGLYEKTPGVVDVDWYVAAPQKKFTFTVDKEKAALSGVSTEAAAMTMSAGLQGLPAGLVHFKDEREPVEIVLRMPESQRTGTNDVLSLYAPSQSGKLVPVRDLVNVKEARIDQPIYHKNLQRVVYVIGDVAGKEESPIYAILKLRDKIAEAIRPGGRPITQHYTGQPRLEENYSIKWDGEWHITYEVFRDLGIAFAAVLVLIYILVVAWFGNFTVPLIIMAPIPLTLVGILPGHFLFGAFFTATSMIGFIALAGIIVRNSILLVDFVQAHWASCGSLKEALIEAGAVRFRPIALTAAAVVVGASVILFDPIFQGLAISLMFGAVAATGLTLLAVPLIYYEFFKSKPCPRRTIKEENSDVHA
jgi:multidrug efflux pump subunit AcrB